MATYFIFAFSTLFTVLYVLQNCDLISHSCDSIQYIKSTGVLFLTFATLFDIIVTLNLCKFLSQNYMPLALFLKIALFLTMTFHISEFDCISHSSKNIANQYYYCKATLS